MDAAKALAQLAENPESKGLIREQGRRLAIIPSVGRDNAQPILRIHHSMIPQWVLTMEGAKEAAWLPRSTEVASRSW